MKTTLFLLFFFPLFTACVKSQPFDESYRQSIQSVSIHVEELPKFSYFGPAYAFKQGLGVTLGGAIGGAVASDEGTSKDDEYAEAFRKQDYDLAKALKQSFEESLQSKTGIQSREENADATVTISVVRYGLAKGWGLTDKTAPFISARVEMKDRNDKIIWRQIESLDSQSYDCTFHSSEEWLADPSLLVAEYNRSIKIFMDNVASSASSKPEK